jgi:uncharacterized protein with GYD domain
VCNARRTSINANFVRGETIMPTYITLMKWTQQGVQTAKDAPARLDVGKQLVKSLGGEIKGFYLVMGEFDFVLITEAPDDETVAKAIILTGMQGNVSTRTMRAFTEDEYRNIIASLP